MKNLICILLFLIPILCLGQTSSDAGIILGGTNYLGDLANDWGSSEEIGFGGGITGRLMLTNKFGLRANIMFMTFTGADANVERNQFRDWSMELDMIEASLYLEYHPIGQARRNIIGQYNEHQISPFLFLGAGGAFGSAMVSTPPSEEGLFPEELDASSFFVIPMGFGVRYDISPYATISAEYGLRAVFSDYFDGVSQLGNPDANDWYEFAGITYTITLHGDLDRNL